MFAPVAVPPAFVESRETDEAKIELPEIVMVPPVVVILALRLFAKLAPDPAVPVRETAPVPPVLVMAPLRLIPALVAPPVPVML